MDNKTWQQGNLGSTGNGRSLQALQHQQLPSSATGSIYPGSISTISNQTGTQHWQRIACCNAFNGAASSQNHLLSHQQQPQQNQVQQQQQAPQLRYFQVQKSTNPQYSTQIPPANSGSLQQHNQTHQQHFAQHYAVLTAPSSLPPAAISASSNQITSERSGQHKCETLSYSGCYLANPFQSSHKAAAIAQALTLKSAEEGQIHHHHHHPNSRNNHQHNQNNLQQTLQSLSNLSPAYQPRYQIVANGHFAIPAAGEVSLTTCFALTSTKSPNATSIEASVYTSTSSSLVDQVSVLPRIIPAYRRPSLPPFVNAFEAVPDMLRDVRPGTTPFTARSSLTPFMVSQTEFSYHASKPQLSIRLETAVVATVETVCDRNWPELSLKCRRPVLSAHQEITSVPEKAEKRIWKKIALIEEPCKEKSFKSTTRRSIKQQSTSSGQKTYAAAVQVTGRQDIRERSYRERTIMCELMSARLRIQEAMRVNTISCASSFHTSTPRKMEIRGMKKKREYVDSCEEDNEYSSTSMVSSSTNDTLSITPERFSSSESGTLKNSKKVSSASSLQEEGKESFEADERGANVSSRKRLCKMAESFCFRELENAAFFRAFDEYSRRRRRMSYTQKLEDGTEANSCHREAASAADTRLSLDHKMKVFGNEFPPRFQSIVYTALQDNGLANNSAAGNMQIRVNAMHDQGAFKVLQKLKECADGTGALYTNSWRPEELHFLHRCYRNKNP